MNWAVSSIQPASSTAPARRNISQGERACFAPAASAAARVPSKCRKWQPATSATRSITPLPLRSTRNTSRTTPAAAPGTSAASVATAGCSTPSVGMITLSIYGASRSKWHENPALLSPCHDQISPVDCSFLRQAGQGRTRSLALASPTGQCPGAMPCDHRFLAGGNDEDIDRAAFAVDAVARPIVGGRVRSHAEPVQPLADLPSYRAAVLADAAGEDQAVQPAQCVGHGGGLLSHAKAEEIDRLGCRRILACLKRAHIGGQSG